MADETKGQPCEHTMFDPFGQAAFPIVATETKSEPNCYVLNGQLKCKLCRHRIPTKKHTEYYRPKYPHCPWCGAKMEVEEYDR